MQSALDSRKRRVLKFAIDATDFVELEGIAAAAGLTPAQVAALWIVERVRRSTSRVASDAASHAERRPAPARARRQAGALHEEIASVLSDNGAPMTVAEIAAEIRRRGRYTAPRSGRPITTELVSTRVANPHYRKLFARSGRLLSLAADDSPKASKTSSS
jgi:hypothetical protein